jgi:hypothetical protein
MAMHVHVHGLIKTPLFFEKRGIGQPAMIPPACECGIEFIQRHFVFKFLLSEFSFQIHHSHEKVKKHDVKGLPIPTVFFPVPS